MRGELMASLGRRRGLSALAALSIVALLVAGAWSLTRGGSTDPAAVSLAQLAADTEAYAGHEVQTHGVVRRFVDPEGSSYYVVEDGVPNRVEIEPASAASPYVGQQVTVRGQFHFDDQQGRVIVVDRLMAD